MTHLMVQESLWRAFGKDLLGFLQLVQLREGVASVDREVANWNR